MNIFLKTWTKDNLVVHMTTPLILLIMTIILKSVE